MNAMQPPQSIEEIKAGLETTEKGGVRQSIRNCLTVFQRDPLLSGAIAYNILTDRKDIIKPIGFHRESTALNDTDMKYLLLYLEETYGLTNEKKIDNAIGIVANENKYHPIRDYLSALVWDGTERIRFCLRHFLGADADDYTYEALKLFLLGAISRAFQPGCKFEIMLCLVGGQGAGKSTFFRLLAIRDEWFSDDLRKLDDDNGQQGAGNGPRVNALVGHKMLVLGADDCVNIDLRQRIVGSIAPAGTDGVVHGSHWVTAGGTAVQLPALIKEPTACQQPAKQQDAKNNKQALL